MMFFLLTDFFQNYKDTCKKLMVLIQNHSRGKRA